MTRYCGAIIFSALSVALAAAPAHSLQDDWPESGPLSTVEFRFSADAALVFAAADYGGSTLADLDLGFEWEGISDNGWRWGADIGLQAQADSPRDGFANQAANAAPPRRSLATGRYTGGAPEGGGEAFAASRASLFLRTGWGELRAGLTPGAAALETVPMPTGSAFLRLDGGPLATPYGAAIRTLNAASGLGPTLVYTTPRIVGLSASASFTPQTRYCGIDFCTPGASAAGPASARLDSVFEGALSFDHTFDSVGRVRLGANIAFADPASPAFSQDYAAYGLQARWSQNGWNAGLSALWSDNAVSGGRYSAVMTALRYDFGDWSVGAEWARAEDDFLGEDQTATQFTISRLVGDAHSVAFGLHDIETDLASNQPLAIGINGRNGVGVFLEIAVSR
ncbi:porin [Hyphobacterium sp.]|uniref:porin n=1 Tax=Hyphobacterium sp. TaxID=2004662 RepID=UPI003B519285